LAAAQSINTGASALTGQGDVKTEAAPPRRSVTLRRLGPAFIMIALALATVLAGGWLFAAMAAVCCVLMFLEWQTMTGVGRTSPTGVLQSSAGIAAVGLSAWGAPDAGLAVVGFGAVAAGIAAAIERKTISHAILGVLYLGLPAIAIIWLRALPEVGLVTILWIYSIVWAGDTAAYGFGRWLGGPKLIPIISPNKTWSGAIGGAVASVAAGVAAVLLFSEIGSWSIAILASLAIGIAAQIGDLVESLIKRQLNVKDSGNLLPGHGGLLDRIDSLLGAVTVAFLIYILFAVQGPLWGG